MTPAARRLVTSLAVTSLLLTSPRAMPAMRSGGGLELGVTYTLAYNTTVLLSELRQAAPGGVKDVGYQILADAECSVIWQHPEDDGQQLIMLTVSSPQLLVRSRRAPQPDGFAAHGSLLEAAPAQPLLVLTGGPAGAPPRLWRHPQLDEQTANLARGLVGLLRLRAEGQYRETDASGACDVTYRWDGPLTLVKTKERCEAAAPVHTASHRVLDVSVTSVRETRFAFSAGGGSRLESSSSEERHQLTPAVRGGYGTEVAALQALQVTGCRLYLPAQ
ncbi:microsomal triglyceride transfer protein large subunit-like [Pollicipes pollicipes]|uniref:microsomal triglyceride transfer protein large subunit-like n=1 Tax=Pollicipes pollicipes TaxID=41117 RepID=UPI00188547CB|nr:microsomal triglyceride transfer protein large subunit-like [Pollicipes pollicipes]